jgi:fructose-1,6-bisphosphatase/inositol monophosphatase family enzyme
VLVAEGLGVLSEESGLHHGEREVVVVLDPVDGSTNASRGIPWYATSLAAVDADGLRAALVVDQASGERFDALRGGGARLDGRPIAPSTSTRLGDAVVAITGYPGARRGRHLPWGQHRVLGAAALDLCAVACGRLDAFADTHETGGLGPWDHLGGLLVCQEAGAVAADALGRPLVTLGHGDRRAPVAAATAALLDELVEALRDGDRDGDGAPWGITRRPARPDVGSPRARRPPRAAAPGVRPAPGAGPPVGGAPADALVHRRRQLRDRAGRRRHPPRPPGVPQPVGVAGRPARAG